MLNSEEAIEYNKTIVLGVSNDNPHHLKGIDFLGNAPEKFDDASYQTVFDRITLQPHIAIGMLYIKIKFLDMYLWMLMQTTSGFMK